MDFKKEERDALLRDLSHTITTFAIFSEPDEKEDGASQLIRKKVREFTDRLFDLQDEVNGYFEAIKADLDE